MKEIDINHIRKEFLDFFESKDHLIVKSFSLIPEDDDSLLLINAGMAPLKKYFTGEKKMQKDRLSTSQRCIRTADIDNVGITQRHATFFEMLGNFSFGDYFKKEAIEWAWEFLTEHMEIPKDNIWISVYEEDDEAFSIWEDHIGIDPEKIVRLGKEDNFWELEEGPCGPCSEIHIDRGEKYGCGDPNCKPGCDCDRFLEVWNLVFTQFNKDKEGNYLPLKHPNIDTGMGLERLAMIKQNVDNIFEIQTMKDIISEIEKLSNKKYKNNEKNDISIRIIADHAKAMTFLVYDGVIPSNEGRGYILRRIIRRAARHGKLLDIKGDFLNKIVDKVMAAYNSSYPELMVDEERIHKIISIEEKNFQETIDNGLNILDEFIQKAKSSNKNEIDGKDAFRLYDTFGFPIDLTMEILSENGLHVDLDDFNAQMEEQKIRSRKAHTSGNVGWSGDNLDYLKEIPKTKFVGYDILKTNSKIIALYEDGTQEKTINKGETAFMIVEKTPFYGEGGGQIGDTGIVSTISGKAQVTDTIKNKNNGIIHQIKVLDGSLEEGQDIELHVNEMRRRDIMKNHSATHLLHQALRDVLGDHIHQAGSLVTDERLRFDITHYESIDSEDLSKIQDIVNEKIALGLKVDAQEMSFPESQEIGAVGLFEDKYQDIVRVLTIDDYSIELCGGTHVNTTSDIQMFKILSESSVAAGVRRIEAITGRKVYDLLKSQNDLIENLKLTAKVKNENELTNRFETLDSDNKSLMKEINQLKQKSINESIDEIYENRIIDNDYDIITYRFKDIDMNALRNIADSLKKKLSDGVVVLATTNQNKINFVATVTDTMIQKGVFAGNIVKNVAQITGGNGGGRKDFAAAGGKDINKVIEALEEVPSIIESMIKE